MQCNLTTLFLTVIYSVLIVSCDNKDLFYVEGKINADSGTVVLDPFYDHDYFIKPMQLSSEVKNGEFSFSGSMEYPMGFTLSYEDAYTSQLFVLDPGNQEMIINLNEREVPYIENTSMREYRESYSKFYEEVRERYDVFYRKRDSINNFYQQTVPEHINLLLEKEIKVIYQLSDSVLLNYISYHPDSFIALWKLIEIFSFDGYNFVFDSAFENFSSQVKTTFTGSVLGSKIATSRLLSEGKLFPTIPLLNIYFDSITSIIPNDREYILMDFWYSSCRPCIDQFPELNSIYDDYQDKGFEIIGISSDRREDKSKWLEAIVKYELPWHQYLDIDAAWCKKMAINKFPTNYLLDGNGLIVAKDLRPVELKEFLDTNL